MSLKNIDRKIASFASNRQKLAEQGQEIALMIFDHAVEHHDCTRALALASEMPKSWKVQLADWFKQFTPIIVVEKNGKVGFSPAYLKARKDDPEAAAKMWDRPGAEETPFYKLNEPDPEDKAYDFAALVKMVQALSARIEKQVEQGKVKAEDTESAKAIARTLSGLNFTPIRPEKQEPANNDAPVDEGNLKVVNG